MSCFVDFLRFIFCCYVREDEEYEPINRNYETYQRSYASPPTISTPFIKQSNTYTTSYSPIQEPRDVHKLSVKSTSSSIRTQETRTKTSIPTNLPQKLNASSVTPNVLTKSAIQYENIITKVSECPNDFSQPASSSLPKSHLPSSKPTIMSLAPSTSTNRQGKTNYVLVQKPTSPTYAIPEDLKILFERDVVPPILKKNVTPSIYKEYFETLLYAEDFYIEKWNGFKIKDVTLELHEAAIYKKRGNWNVNEERDEKVFVAFKMDSVPERRPFLLSRDFVFVRPSGRESASFQGVIYRVVKSNLVLIEFEEDFHHQHSPWCKYDVQFSFNRVCLKRAHQSVSAASDPLFHNFLFPDSIHKNSTSSTPYIIEGPLSVKKPTWSSTSRDSVHETVLSRTGELIRDIVLKSYRTCPSCHILICAPTNKTCDVITRNLQEEIPDIFRANAAFRELDGVPLEIFPNCRYKKEVFSCPPVKELRQFKVVVSTFMSAFRLYNEGLTAGHFSHIFLVDTSSITEPEAMVALANLADDETVVVVSGKMGNHSGWVRSNIARRHGLMVSFFERIRQCKMYQSLDSRFIAQLKDSS